MARPKGYGGYRGRGSKWKILLAVFLVLVILAAAVVILLQRNIVYDATGTPQLVLPWAEEETPQQEQETPPVDLVIQEPEMPEKSVQTYTAVLAKETPLTMEAWQGVREKLASDERYDALAVTLKDGSGKVYFDAPGLVSGAVNVAGDTAAALAEVTGGDFYSIARISCFRDPRAANGDVEGRGLKNTGGYIFYDGNNQQWLDPAKSAAREYLSRILAEAAELGFDEILLTDVSYPTEGKLDKIAYGDVNRSEQLCAFLQEVRELLEPYEVALGIEVSQTVVETGRDEAAGLALAEIAPLVDRIYAPAALGDVEKLSEQVAAAAEGTVFVPLLESDAALPEGNCLIG